MALTAEEQLVRSFFQAFEQDLRSAYDQYFADDVAHINSGMRTMDKAETLAAFFGPDADLGFTTIRVDILRLAQSGRHVFTERVDYHLNPEGRAVLVTPVCGVIEIADGKIVRMAEYFDSAFVKAYFESRTNVTETAYMLADTANCGSQ